MKEVPTLVDIETRQELFDMVAKEFEDDDCIVEVGTFLGGSICYLTKRFLDHGKTPDIHAIDTWECNNISDQAKNNLGVTSKFYEQFWENVKENGFENRIAPIISDSIKATEVFDDGSISFLFLDGCHDYPYVLDELKAWLPKMRKGGIIAGHDYCSSDGIRKAVVEVLGEVNLTSNQASYWKVIQ